MAKLTIEDQAQIRELDVEAMSQTVGGQRQFEDLIKDLESQDKLGNFEIQDLMSRFNQAQTLSSSVLKKQDSTKNGTISKI